MPQALIGDQGVGQTKEVQVLCAVQQGQRAIVDVLTAEFNDPEFLTGRNPVLGGEYIPRTTADIH